MNYLVHTYLYISSQLRFEEKRVVQPVFVRNVEHVDKPEYCGPGRKKQCNVKRRCLEMKAATVNPKLRDEVEH